MTPQRQDALRITLTITICMLAGKLLHLDSPVYLALYPTILMTKGKDYSWAGMLRTFLPTFAAASLALLICEIFANHPFVIWTLSLLFFDTLRRRADTPAKAGAMLMPTFNWILIIVFSQHTSMDMPMRIHEIGLSMLITACVAKAMLLILPQAKGGKPPAFSPKPVSFQQRLVSLGLIGGGLACLMIVDIVSATFCMVPVVAAATQPGRDKFLEVVERRFITQVGGCAIAVIFTLLMAGHQSILSYYALGLGTLIFLITNWMTHADGPARDLHADALLATLLPIQLYMGNQTLGLESTYLRAWELTVTLGILFTLHQLTRRSDNTRQAR
ncbi:DUF2955 domain-containing protein [Photobacterium aquae]|nr:DUF2955 domain-containing protein [Photobacterium aquae]